VAHADADLDAGVDAFRLGKYADARRLLEKARAKAPKQAAPVRFLAAVAQAEQSWPECLSLARTALELEPTGARAGETRKLHEQCRIGAGRSPWRTAKDDAAGIAVTANVSGATVKINGLTYGGTPLEPREIVAGKPLAIEVGKLGYQTARVEAVAVAGIVTDIAVELIAAPEVEPGSGGSGAKGSARTPGTIAPRHTGCCGGTPAPSPVVPLAAALFVFVVLRDRRRT
jgi:hypothetical protein